MTRGKTMGPGHKVLLAPALIAAAGLALCAGCVAGAYSRTNFNGHTKVYRNDEAGEKRLVYEVAPDGALTVYDEADPQAQQERQRRAQAEAMLQARADRQERVKAAPKRRAGEPIFVALTPTDVDPNLAKAQHSEGSIFEAIREGFEGDSVIRLVDCDRQKGKKWSEVASLLSGRDPEASPAADVDVRTSARLKEVVGIRRDTGNVGKGVVILFEATVVSNYLAGEYTVTESTGVLDNVEGTRRFVARIKETIQRDIAPTLPADRSL